MEMAWNFILAQVYEPCNIFQLQISVGKGDTVCLAIFMFLLNYMIAFRF